MMDLSAPLTFVSIFVVASISLFLVYKFGIKKKSYEEALAEHRKQTSALLGSSKPKPKEKKSKKAAKRINKEKSAASNSPDNESPDDTESVDSKDTSEKSEIKSQPQQLKAEQKVKASPKQSKVHVEFKEKPEEVPIDVPVEKEVKDVMNKKRVKKVRPILVKKGAAGLEKIPPVDVETPPAVNHFEEIHPKDEFELLRSHSRDDLLKTEQPSKDETKKQAAEKPSKKSKKPDQSSQQQQQQVDKTGPAAVVETQAAAAVEKEKPKEEKAIENTVVASTAHEPVIVNVGKEKKKKKSEFNAKQQMTADRDQLIHSVRNAELSRTEVQLLIDLLLNKQLEAPAQIDDWSEGKSDPVQKLKKQLAEKEKLLKDEQDAVLAAQAKLREVRSEQQAERTQLRQEARAAEEARAELVAAHARAQAKAQELEELRNKELANFQRVVEDNKALQMQRGQLEAALMNYQETDNLILNLKTDNSHLGNELQRLTQDMQEQATNYQNCVMQIQTLQEELRSRNDYIINLERNHSFAMSAQMEEKRGLKEELQRLADNARMEEQRLIEITEQLKADNQRLQQENNSQINGSADETKANEVKVLNLSNELSSVKSELSFVAKKFQEAERQHQTETAAVVDQCTRLKAELEEQKNKNNELRVKNWKVMEALNAAENRTKPTAVSKTTDTAAINKEQATPLSSPESSTEVTKLHNEIRHYKKIIDETEGILKRLQSHIEQEERNWRFELRQKDAEIAELKQKSLSQRHDSDSDPNSSDSNGMQFAYECIEKSLPVIIDELQVKVSSLESQLAQEKSEKERLLDERHRMTTTTTTNTPQPKSVHADSTATIERLSEEVNRLREQLRIEQLKNSEATCYQNAQTHNSTNGQKFVEGTNS